MDVRCPICGETWDQDELHEDLRYAWDDDVRKAATKIDTFMEAYKDVSREWPEDTEDPRFYRQVDERSRYLRNWRLFKKYGCRIFGSSHGSIAVDAPYGDVYDICGDDVDGSASMVDEI